MSYVPLHHKYRPKTFAQLVGQEAIAITLSNAIRTEKIAPAYLFTGPRGTGKTSSARILAKSLNCLSSNVPTPEPCGVCEVCQGINKGSILDVIEIDAASNTGVDNVRDIIELAQYAPVQCRYKVYVIDECHMLSTQAFNALLKTLEEPPKHVVFVLATTDPQRVLSTIISRCQRFDFRRIPIEAIVKHLTDIASKEEININSQAITLVAQLSQGGLRDAQSLLDQLWLLEGEVVPERIWDLVGSVSEPDLLALLKAITTDNPEVVLDSTRKILDRGREPLIILQNFASFYRDLLIAKTAPSRQDLVAYTPEIWQSLCQISQKLEIGTILAGQERLRASEVQLKNTTQPRLWLEVTLLGLLPSANQIGHSHISSNGVSNGNGGVRPISPNPVNPNPQPNPSPPSIPPTQQTPTQQPQPTYQNGTNETNVPANAPKIVNPSNGATEHTSPPPLSPSLDLVQIWQQVLSNLQPISRRSLLNQMCRLLDFDGKVASLAIQQAWYKKVQTDLPIITDAFKITFQSDIKVNLEIANSSGSTHVSKEASRNGLNQPRTFVQPTPQLPTPQLPSPQTADYNPPKEPESPVNQTPIKNEPPSTTVVQTTTLVPATPIVPHKSETPPPPPTPEEPPPQLDRQAQEVISAAKNLAEFFFGQVVGVDDGKDFSGDSAAEFVEEIDADDEF